MSHGKAGAAELPIGPFVVMKNKRLGKKIHDFRPGTSINANRYLGYSKAKTGIDFRKTSADDFVLRCQRALGINVDALNKQGNRMAILRFYLQDQPKGKWVKFEIGRSKNDTDSHDEFGWPVDIAVRGFGLRSYPQLSRQNQLPVETIYELYYVAKRDPNAGGIDRGRLQAKSGKEMSAGEEGTMGAVHVGGAKKQSAAEKKKAAEMANIRRDLNRTHHDTPFSHSGDGTRAPMPYNTPNAAFLGMREDDDTNFPNPGLRLPEPMTEPRFRQKGYLYQAAQEVYEEYRKVLKPNGMEIRVDKEGQEIQWETVLLLTYDVHMKKAMGQMMVKNQQYVTSLERETKRVAAKLTPRNQLELAVTLADLKELCNPAQSEQFPVGRETAKAVIDQHIKKHGITITPVSTVTAIPKNPSVAPMLASTPAKSLPPTAPTDTSAAKAEADTKAEAVAKAAEAASASASANAAAEADAKAKAASADAAAAAAEANAKAEAEAVAAEAASADAAAAAAEADAKAEAVAVAAEAAIADAAAAAAEADAEVEAEAKAAEAAIADAAAAAAEADAKAAGANAAAAAAEADAEAKAAEAAIANAASAAEAEAEATAAEAVKVDAAAHAEAARAEADSEAARDEDGAASDGEEDDQDDDEDLSEFEDGPDPNDLSYTAGTGGWVHQAPSNDKAKLKAWFTNILQDGDGSFDEEDNGNFCVHEINRALGQYVLGIVFKQKMTVHFTVINGDESTINNKAYYGFKTIDQMVQMLSDQHTIDNVLSRKFPVCLLKGWRGETDGLKAVTAV